MCEMQLAKRENCKIITQNSNNIMTKAMNCDKCNMSIAT